MFVCTLQEWVPGGELFHHLDLEGAFDEPTAMFFAASVLLSLESLHVKGIVYRDLKPENLLLDAQGYIKVRTCLYIRETWILCTYLWKINYPRLSLFCVRVLCGVKGARPCHRDKLNSDMQQPWSSMIMWEMY